MRKRYHKKTNAPAFESLVPYRAWRYRLNPADPERIMVADVPKTRDEMLRHIESVFPHYTVSSLRPMVGGGTDEG